MQLKHSKLRFTENEIFTHIPSIQFQNTVVIWFNDKYTCCLSGQSWRFSRPVEKCCYITSVSQYYEQREHAWLSVQPKKFFAENINCIEKLEDYAEFMLMKGLYCIEIKFIVIFRIIDLPSFFILTFMGKTSNKKLI